MTRVAIATFAFLIIWTIFTAVFAASADKTEVRLMPKWLWVLLCVFLPFFGGLLYLMVGRPLRPNLGPSGGKGRVIAPDDDPNFLRDISKMMRKKDEDDKDDKDSK
ncbi:MAG: PLD nuclease N-terminal domain-containing protein [Aquiluna sp.]|nr:PLD nuclease N-terminal domain-containing protein [Aquiluna sp.]